MKKINEINTREELAEYLGIRTQLLTYVLYGKESEEFYTRFTIPKKSGGEREIYSPINPLKNIQKRLSQKINEHMDYNEKESKTTNKISHGFVKSKSIITNARIHRNKCYVLNVDLESFFPTLHFGRVRGFFIKNKHFKLNPTIATVVAQLTCYKGSLPQGAPTSPIISNLIANILDINVLKLTQKYNLDYTRYVDDLTFSTNEKKFKFIEENFLSDLENVIKKSGFKINNNKTRLQYCDSRQIVTGLVVNQKINTKKEFHKNTRAMANSLYSEGQFHIDGQEGNIEQLNGRFSFINQLDWYNKKDKEIKYDKKEIPYYNLNSREKEYQKFIFYKKFINNKTLLITEGKTDIKYLKAAFKNKYTDFPDFIKKKNGSEFIYNVSFLNRFNYSHKDNLKQNKWLYFLNLGNDGASPISKIIDLYIGVKVNKKEFPGYWNFFFKKKGATPNNPVIIILDNDQELRKFINCNCEKIVNYNLCNDDKWRKSKITKEKLNKKFKEKIYLDLEQTNYTHLIGNIYLLTLPKKEDKNVEMEDLFDDQVIQQFYSKNNNKKVQSKILKIKEKDKNIFSNYVSINYQTINFNGFNSVLDNLNEIIEIYKKHLYYNKNSED